MIRSVEIENFKCFREVHLRLGNATVLSGVNGTGKSSFVQTVLALRQSHLQGQLVQNRLAINGDLVQIGSGQDALCEYAERDTIKIALTWDDDTTATWTFDYDRAADILLARQSSVPDGTFNRPPFAGPFHFISAERLGPRVTFAMADHAVRSLRELGPRGAYAAHYLAVFGRERCPLPTAHHKDATTTTLLDQVEAWLGEMSPGARVHVAEQRDLDLVSLNYSFSGQHGRSNPYRATNVGFGLTYTLSLVVALLAADAGALLFLENPEAHLHPRAQTKLAELIARVAAGGAQVVVETHSDHIINGLRLAVHGGLLRPEALLFHYFERNDSADQFVSVVSPSIDRNGRLSPLPTGFFDEWESSLSALLELPAGSES